MEQMFMDYIILNSFDKRFSDKEIELLDSLIELSLKKGDLVSEEELKRALN